MKILMFKTFYSAALFAGLAIVAQSTSAQQMPCANFNQEFKVYFESDKSVAGRYGLLVVDQAIQNIGPAVHCNLERITVTGYTDRHGSEQKNFALSRAMAFSIGDYLMEHGVPKDVIRIYGKGEAELAKATDDDVTDPLNRRVVVKINFAEN